MKIDLKSAQASAMRVYKKIEAAQQMGLDQMQVTTKPVSKPRPKVMPSFRKDEPEDKPKLTNQQQRDVRMTRKRDLVNGDILTHEKEVFDKVEIKNESAYVDHDLDGIKKFKELEKGAYTRKNKDAFGVQKPDKKVHHPLFDKISKNDLKRGIIFSEVFGKPKGLQ